MRKLLLLISLSVVLALVLAPAAVSQDGNLEDDMINETVTPTATSGCTTTTDPETGESVTTCIDTAPPTATTGTTPTTTLTPTPTSTITPTSTATIDGDGGTLPKTGGAGALALLAGALLVGGGVMSFALFRRR